MQTATIFNLETVPLDDEVFTDCEFRDCRMVYSGGKPPVFDNCRFDACDWRFDDAAAPWIKARQCFFETFAAQACGLFGFQHHIRRGLIGD